MGHLRTTDVWEGAEVTSLPRAAPNNPVERTGDSVVFFLFVRLSPVTRRSQEALGGTAKSQNRVIEAENLAYEHELSKVRRRYTMYRRRTYCSQTRTVLSNLMPYME